MSHVYLLRDKEGAPLYIGFSANPEVRVLHHRAKPWGSRIASVEIEGPMPRAEAFACEADAIRLARPPFNRQRTGKRRRRHQMTEVVQVAAIVPVDLAAKIKAKADEAERSVAAEIRLALKAWTEAA